MYSIRGLRVDSGQQHDNLTLIHRFDLDLQPGEIHGLIGESGSGKTLASMSFARLYPELGLACHADTWRFADADLELDLIGASAADIGRLRRGPVAYVLQNSLDNLNPWLTVGSHFEDLLAMYGNSDATSAREQACSLLDELNLENPRRLLDRYPRELSGGMSQRVQIALALAGEPRLLIADEPGSGLDAFSRSQLVDLLRRLSQDRGMAMLVITHSISMAADLCSRISIMYGGYVVEQGPTRPILAHPVHPYTRALIRALPDVTGGGLPEYIPGRPAEPAMRITGCPFHPRCPRAVGECGERMPELRIYGEISYRCHHPLENGGGNG
jgi:oligopeptide/dipeptide ABC transporter ATP-binding protein